MPRDAPSSDRILLLPERRLQPLPHTALGLRFLLHGQHGLPFLPADLADQGVEHVVDVVAVGGRRLEEGTAELSGQSQSFFLADLSQLPEVRLVPHEDHRGVVGAAHSVNELLELANFVEAAPVRDGVADDEALPRPHVLVPHGSELRLSGRIQDVQVGRLIIDADPDFIGILYRREGRCTINPQMKEYETLL